MRCHDYQPGDRLNFGLAAEQARALGLAVDVVIVADDVALGTNRSHARGIAGTALVCSLTVSPPPRGCQGSGLISIMAWVLGAMSGGVLCRRLVTRYTLVCCAHSRDCFAPPTNRCTKLLGLRPRQGFHWLKSSARPKLWQTRPSRLVRAGKLLLTDPVRHVSE